MGEFALVVINGYECNGKRYVEDFVTALVKASPRKKGGRARGKAEGKTALKAMSHSLAPLLESSAKSESSASIRDLGAPAGM